MTVHYKVIKYQRFDRFVSHDLLSLQVRHATFLLNHWLVSHRHLPWLTAPTSNVNEQTALKTRANCCQTFTRSRARHASISYCVHLKPEQWPDCLISVILDDHVHGCTVRSVRQPRSYSCYVRERRRPASTNHSCRVTIRRISKKTSQLPCSLCV